MNESERSLAVNAGTWVPTDALPGERHERAHLLFESNFKGTWSQYIDAVGGEDSKAVGVEYMLGRHLDRAIAR
jgi:hypothetical protein